MPAKPKFIDAHAHIWVKSDGRPLWIRQKIAALNDDFNFARLQQDSLETSPSGIILIQATATSSETEQLLAEHRRNDLVVGVIGWVDLGADPEDLQRTVQALKSDPLFSGVRAYPNSGFQPGWLFSEPVKSGLKTLAKHNVPVDFLSNFEESPGLVTLLGETGNAPAILDHGGRAHVMTGNPTQWLKSMQLLANETEIYCKISGLIERAGVEWTVESLKPWVAGLLDSFGADRLIFGSNWPIVNLMGSYSLWYETLCQVFQGLGVAENEQAMIFHRNAQKVYVQSRAGNSE